ncbi:cohesin domain-containing protein [Natronorarus salvus]|uniref:cohesin domain-containing protein n=1 Tax=Natronorarus salvus TaxID=3117733 RepID=UPI002F26C7A0
MKNRRGLLALAGGAIVGSAGVASAGDNLTVLQFAESEIEAESGEVLALDVLARSHGGYGDSAVASIEFEIHTDPAAIAITEVKAGPWMEGGDAEVVTETAFDDGVVSVSQTREPVGDGIAGAGRVATVTVVVSEGLGPAEALLEFDGSEVMLTDRYPQPVVERPARIVVDGGGKEFAHVDSEPGVTTPDDEGEGTTEGADARTGSDGDDGSKDDAEGVDDGDAGSDDGAEGANDDDDGGEGEAGTSDDQTGFGTLAAGGALGLVLWRFVLREDDRS